VLNQCSHRVDAEVKFYKYEFPILEFPNLVLRDVLKATLITLCFILTDDLQIYIPKFVTGHVQWRN